MKYLYVITDGEDFKIGVAKDPEKRIRQLQTGNKKKLEFALLEQKNNAHKVEHYLHGQFGKYRIKGEWFSGITLRDIKIQLLLCTEYD